MIGSLASAEKFDIVIFAKSTVQIAAAGMASHAFRSSQTVTVSVRQIQVGLKFQAGKSAVPIGAVAAAKMISAFMSDLPLVFLGFSQSALLLTEARASFSFCWYGLALVFSNRRGKPGRKSSFTGHCGSLTPPL